MNVLLAGESWMTHSVHVKGFDSFTTTSYHEGAGPLREALSGSGHQVDYLPNHLAASDFPVTLPDLGRYEVVILSDIGSNTLLLPDATFIHSERGTNRLDLLGEFVERGGGLLMIGGYLTFQGIDGKGRYHDTPVEAALPVTFQAVDDRVELPEGGVPTMESGDHPVALGLDAWPHFLGYNRATLKEDATQIASLNGDPFLAVSEHGQGRGAIFASDCGPHWGPPEFLRWPGYATLWNNLTVWLGGGDR